MVMVIVMIVVVTAIVVMMFVIVMVVVVMMIIVVTVIVTVVIVTVIVMFVIVVMVVVMMVMMVVTTTGRLIGRLGRSMSFWDAPLGQVNGPALRILDNDSNGGLDILPNFERFDEGHRDVRKLDTVVGKRHLEVPGRPNKAAPAGCQGGEVPAGFNYFSPPVTYSTTTL